MKNINFMTFEEYLRESKHAQMGQTDTQVSQKHNYFSTLLESINNVKKSIIKQKIFFQLLLDTEHNVSTIFCEILHMKSYY